ncbi:DUF4244 domain-containing protein [Kitasatospora sp. NPDC008050]|uniref:DUF4244 domain-containing protein n=1 Tax=Kitasatospora sp. NPDC008050 TaxID=3364021 RepID=UPI0036ED6B25
MSGTNSARGGRRAGARGRDAGRGRLVVTFIASPAHGQAEDGRPESGALAAVRRLPVVPVADSTADFPDPLRVARRPGLAGRASPPTHRRPRHQVRRPVREAVRCAWHRLLRRARQRFAGAGDQGMSTAEYAIGTVAACGFAALLYKVVTGGAVTTALTDLLDRALHAV